MGKLQDDVMRDALSLPPQARADLAERLLDSVAPTEATDEDASLAEEAERRLRAYEAGEVQSIPAAEVFRDLLSKGRK
jgi:putative addiction module component (TIGR02574 family)